MFICIVQFNNTKSKQVRGGKQGRNLQAEAEHVLEAKLRMVLLPHQSFSEHKQQ